MVIYDYSTDCHAVPDYFYQTRAAEIARAPDTETVRHRDRFASGSIGCGWLESYAFRRFGRICLKVIFVRDGNLIKIITQHFVDEP